MLLLALAASTAAAKEPPKALFALIVGVNQGIDRDLKPLRYADDDAARYLELFRALGRQDLPAHAARRQHPPAAPAGGGRGAAAPAARAGGRGGASSPRDVALARQRQVRTVLYFVYAGHGNLRQGRGYLTLEDRRLGAAELRQQVLDRSGADDVHLIVDACYSYFLAHGRGPGRAAPPAARVQRPRRAGGARPASACCSRPRRPARATSGTRSRRGVFSHEVRSGLYGAADADGDGVVSYREIAAFVQRANAAIPNERFRPELYARPPRGSGELVDLRLALQRRLVIDGAHAGHYVLEDQRGVRVAELHSGKGQPLALLRPAPGGRLYLRRLDDEREFVVEGAPEEVQLAALSPAPARSAVRGAAHEAFSLIFSRPFDRQVVAAFSFPPLPELLEAGGPAERRWRRPAGWSAVALGGAALLTGGALSLWASRLRRELGSAATHEEVAATNRRIETLNHAALGLYVGGGVIGAGGAALLLWPSGSPGAMVTYEGRY